jgi:predicted O-methyltransferase YrrM
MTRSLAEPIEGFTPQEALEWLYIQAQGMHGVLEIGCWKGRTAAVLAESAGHAWTVDHFEGSTSELATSHAEAVEGMIESQARENLKFYNVEILKMTSRQASRLFLPGSLDMVWIDGDHTRGAVLEDLVLWHNKVRKLLCGHDASWDGVQEALAIFGIPWYRADGDIWYMERKL